MLRPKLQHPSGVVTDAATNQPIQGATVMLYHVPGWTARSSDAQNGLANTCESNLSKPASAPWSQSAPTGQGVLADPSSGTIDPEVNPQTTTAQGRYGWDVAAGCWYVVVSKTGYDTLTSPVVGVPPAVTDLDLQLVPVAAPPPPPSPTPPPPAPTSAGANKKKKKGAKAATIKMGACKKKAKKR